MTTKLMEATNGSIHNKTFDQSSVLCISNCADYSLVFSIHE